MKRNKKIDEQALAVQKPTSEKRDSHISLSKKTREQLLEKAAKISCKVTGTQSHKVADRIIAQLSNALVRPKPNGSVDPWIRGAITIAEMAPQNLTEAMLATQMLAAHDAALLFLSRATLDGQYPDAVDTNVLRAIRLMRIFSEQLEAMQKLRGKPAQQKVTVEHVHVHQGGQAIVGAVRQTTATSGVEGENHQ